MPDTSIYPPVYVEPLPELRYLLRRRGVNVHTGIGTGEWVYAYIERGDVSESSELDLLFLTDKDKLVRARGVSISCVRQLTPRALLDIQLMANLNLCTMALERQSDRLLQTLFQHTIPFWKIIPVKSRQCIVSDADMSARHRVLADIAIDASDDACSTISGWVRMLHARDIATAYAIAAVDQSELPHILQESQARCLLKKSNVRMTVKNLSSAHFVLSQKSDPGLDSCAFSSPDHILVGKPERYVGNMMDNRFAVKMRCIAEALSLQSPPSTVHTPRKAVKHLPAVCKTAFAAWSLYIRHLASARLAQTATPAQPSRIERKTPNSVEMPENRLPLLRRPLSTGLWKQVLASVDPGDIRTVMKTVGIDACHANMSAHDLIQTIRVDIECYRKSCSSYKASIKTKKTHPVLQRLREATYNEQRELDRRILQIETLCIWA